MGGTTNTTTQSSTTTPTPTAEETALNQRNLRIAQATEGGQTEAQLNSLALINQLLTGRIPQGELYSKLSGGVSPEAIGNQATTMMRSGRTGAQASGIAESGSADRAIARDIAGNLMFPAEQFNIGAAQNLLNLAISGQAQVQAPVQANVNQLGGQLAGLRTINSTGQSAYRSNPFLQNLYGSLGSTLDNRIGGAFSG